MVTGKFVGPGIYIEELDQTYSYNEINELSRIQFSEFCSFMSEKELSRILRSNKLDMLKEAHIQNIFNNLKG